MTSSGSIVHALAETLVFDYLDSLRKSADLGNPYGSLSHAAKMTTTAKLHEIAGRAAQYFVENVDSLEDLNELPNEELVKKALLRAIDENG